MLESKNILTIEYVPGYEVVEVLGYVKGATVQTKNIGRDFMAGLKNIVGGEITGYTEMMKEARQIATERMMKEADALEADAVIGFRMQTSSVMGQAAEIIAYGTAVRLKRHEG